MPYVRRDIVETDLVIDFTCKLQGFIDRRGDSSLRLLARLINNMNSLHNSTLRVCGHDHRSCQKFPSEVLLLFLHDRFSLYVI